MRHLTAGFGDHNFRNSEAQLGISGLAGRRAQTELQSGGVTREGAARDGHRIHPARNLTFLFFRAASKHASITRCVLSALSGHSRLSLPERAWLTKLRIILA